jgi:hypothetical protein
MRKICVSGAALASLLISAASGGLQSKETASAGYGAPVARRSGFTPAAAFQDPAGIAALLDLGFSRLLHPRRFDGTVARRIAPPQPAAPIVEWQLTRVVIRRRGVSGFRTDRHNNPTAMTTDLAEEAGLVQGEDYIRGDAFRGPDGKTYHTARFLGDPIETSIRAMDQVGLYTQAGRGRWVYLHKIPAAKKWTRLSYEQKAAVVLSMYRMEGGSGELRQRPPAADTGSAAPATR